MHTVWSYGGGWQSVALGVLIRQGTLPKPDLAAIVDTSRECSSTWTYLRDHMQPYLQSIGVKIQIIPHTYSRVDLYAEDGLTLMPAYTAEGRLPAYCAGEWKRDAMERWMRYQGVKECNLWIGFSVDELRRVKKDHRPWCHLAFPLIDLMVNRAMCRTLILEAGLPMPRKSRCWMCPHQSPEEWLEVSANPEEWAAAQRVDQEIRERDPDQAGLYLYSGRTPLALADLARDAGSVSETKICESGNCWT